LFEDGKVISATTQFYTDLGVVAAPALDFTVSAAANIIATKLSGSDKPWSFTRNLSLDVLKQIDYSRIEVSNERRSETRKFGPIAFSQLTEQLGSREFPMLPERFLPEWTAHIAGKTAMGAVNCGGCQENTPQQGGDMAGRFRIEFTFAARSSALFRSKMVFFLPSGWRKEIMKKKRTVYVSPSGTQLRTSPISKVAYESQDSALVGITNRFIVPGGSANLTECQALISPQFIEPTVALTEMTNIASSQPPAKRQRKPSVKAR
jgi:hypothetical protein